jgi:hypothetical protein
MVAVRAAVKGVAVVVAAVKVAGAVMVVIAARVKGMIINTRVKGMKVRVRKVRARRPPLAKVSSRASKVSVQRVQARRHRVSVHAGHRVVIVPAVMRVHTARLHLRPLPMTARSLSVRK